MEPPKNAHVYHYVAGMAPPGESSGKKFGHGKASPGVKVSKPGGVVKPKGHGARLHAVARRAAEHANAHLGIAKARNSGKPMIGRSQETYKLEE